MEISSSWHVRTGYFHAPHITSVQYCGGCSVHWRLFSTSGGNISTVGDNFSTVEVVQYGGGITSVHAGDDISTVGITSVLWRVFSTVEGYLQYCGGTTAVHVGDSFSTVGDNFSTVEVVQYSGG